MLTSSAVLVSLHLAEIRPKILPTHRKIGVFLMHSSDQICQNVTACMVRRLQKGRKSKKWIFFCQHFFSKSKNGHTFHVLFQKKR